MLPQPGCGDHVRQLDVQYRGKICAAREPQL